MPPVGHACEEAPRTTFIFHYDLKLPIYFAHSLQKLRWFSSSLQQQYKENNLHIVYIVTCTKVWTNVSSDHTQKRANAIPLEEK